MAELKEYVDSMYHTAMNKDVALEYCRTQISVLHKELDQNRSRSEDDRKTLIGTFTSPSTAIDYISGKNYEDIRKTNMRNIPLFLCVAYFLSGGGHSEGASGQHGSELFVVED